MSTLVYGAVSRKRSEAEADTSAVTAPPGLKTYVDSLAALVPAEILALHAVVVEATTKTVKVSGRAVTTITDPSTLKAMFWVGVVLSGVLFATGRLMGKTDKGGWQALDWARLAIPPIAFVLWAIIQKSTAWDALAPGDLSDGARVLIGAAGAIVLGIFAAWLGMAQNKAAPGK